MDTDLEKRRGDFTDTTLYRRLLGNAPDEVIGPARRRISGANIVGRVPSRGVVRVFQQAARNDFVRILVGASAFRKYQRAFEHATGLPLTLRAVGSWRLAHTESRKQNGFCSLMSGPGRSCAACLQVQHQVRAAANGAPSTRNCTFGLSETAVGVKVGQNVIAYLQTGQIFFKPPTRLQTERAVKQIKAWGLDLDLNEAARLYAATPVVERSEYQATMLLLQFFADQLGALANQLVLSQQSAEPAQITRARNFIEAQFHEKLTLGEVASQAGMSRFYFCKLFKKATGLNFTDYIARLRVEKAKNLLLNRNYRVSEIGYEVGFQSMTHFNRVFKRIAGESPTLHRRHFPPGAC
jgi:AraC-like DNA-binding protein